jgi:hypothetical protein
MASSIAQHRALPNGARKDASSCLRIVVLGYIVRGPIGGMAWHHLQYVLGLKQLGHDVLFIEDSDDYPSCYDPSTHQVGIDPSYGLRFAEHAFAKLGLAGHWAYFDAHHRRWHGPASGDVGRFCKDADVLVNVSGVNPIRDWLESISVRVFIDTDPAFTQIRHLTNESARSLASQHNAFFSFAGLIGTEVSKIPDDGFRWQPTMQPIVLDAWPVTSGSLATPFTTVMQWDSYPPTAFNGQRFGMKSDSFDFVRNLPNRSARPLEIALGGVSAPRRDIEQLGWRLADPLAVTRDPWTYQDYLQHSFGEFSVAKHGYVASRSGWFSERTACYLALGRPAVVQDTGFSRLLPCGNGLLPFHDAESALDALQLVESDYPAHCRAARELAAAYFDSRKVLLSLLERAVDTAAPSPTVKF